MTRGEFARVRSHSQMRSTVQPALRNALVTSRSRALFREEFSEHSTLMPRRKWTRSELLQVLELYFRTPFGRLHRSNPEIIELAHRIGRTPSAVAMKAVNFASCDKELQARGIRGMRNASAADKTLFGEFLESPEKYLQELEGLEKEPRPAIVESTIADDFPAGRNVEISATSRRGHAFFRSAVYANFDGRCAMSGLRVPSLLTASHIVPWKAAEKLRCDPRNGLLLSALHDRAFDRGLLSVDANFHILASRALKKYRTDEFCTLALLALNGMPLRMPKRAKFLPSREALEYHRDVVFQK